MSGAVRILAVDDDEGILYTLRAIGEVAGWEVDTEGQSGAVIQRLTEEGPHDLVIIDYHMPERDGLKIVRDIRQRGLTVPIVVLTVDERQETADAFLEAGATDFALKPIKAPDLIARIRVHLQLAEASRSQSGQHPAGTEGELPKGIQRSTLEKLIATLRSEPAFFTVEELTEHAGFAYQTVCRYLAYLEEQGRVRVKFIYGSVGRPKKKVRWAREK